ncbi:MAG: GIY-YIG nuclease family protein [Candidatus Hodarchaeales archaeon]
MSTTGLKIKLTKNGFSILDSGNYWTKDELDDVLKEPGLYALFWGDCLQYIGQSINLQNRLKEWERKNYYKKDYIPFGTYSWFVLPEKQLSKAEAMLINYYEPPYNQQYPRE